MNKLTTGLVLAGSIYAGANAISTPEAAAHHSTTEQTCDDATVTFEDMAGHRYLNMPTVLLDDVVVVTLTQDEINQGTAIKTIGIKPTHKTVATSWSVDWNANGKIDAGESYGSTHKLSFEHCEPETPVTTTTTGEVPTTTVVTEVELAPPQAPVEKTPVVSVPDTPRTTEKLAFTGGFNERAARAGVLFLTLGALARKASRRYQKNLQEISAE